MFFIKKYNISYDTNIYKIYRQTQTFVRRDPESKCFGTIALFMKNRSTHNLNTDLITPRLGNVSDPSVGVVSRLVVDAKETNVDAT